MGYIYSVNESVIIWLGLELDEALQTLRAWPQMRDKIQPKARNEEITRLFDIRHGIRPLPKTGPNERLYESLKRDAKNSVSKLLETNYWNQGWIVQEVVLAKTAVVVCGTVALELTDFHSIVESLDSSSRHRNRPPIFKIWEIKEASGTTLLDLLIRFSDSESSKVHDTVYGFLGLAKIKVPALGEGVYSHLFKVDYEKDPFEILWDTAFSFHVPWDRYLDLLSVLGRKLLNADYWSTYWPDSSLSTLEGYRISKRTSSYHSNVARTALRTFNAMNILLPDERSERQSWHIRMGLFLIDAIKIPVPYISTAFQDAAVLGLVLSSMWKLPENSRDKLKRYIWWPENIAIPILSPWRCDAHRARERDSPGAPGQIPGYFQRAETRIWLSQNDLAQACGDYYQSCDGSVLTLEMEDIGFRLVVQSGHDKDTFGTSTLSLELPIRIV